MDCHECKENILLYLDSAASVPAQFENHIKSCASCAKEAAQLKESLRLVKDKEVFIPEFLASEKIERTEIELPQVIKNAVRQDAVHQEFPIIQKEYKFKFAFPSLKFAYAMAIILCVGLGIYFVTFMANNYTLAPKTKIAVNAPVVLEKKHAEPSPVPPKKEDAGLLAINKTKEKSAAPIPAQKKPAKDLIFAKKEVVVEKASIPAPQDMAVSGAENKQSISAKSAYMPPVQEPVPAEIYEKVKKIVSEYKDVSFAPKEENGNIVIHLSCPKEMKAETIEELKNKIFNQTKIDKDKIRVFLK